MKPLNLCFENCKPFQNRLKRSSRKRDPNTTQNSHACTICCRPEVVHDVISGHNVKNIEPYLVVYFEIPSSNSFPDIQKNHFVTTESAMADIEDSITRKRIRASLNNWTKRLLPKVPQYVIRWNELSGMNTSRTFWPRTVKLILTTKPASHTTDRSEVTAMKASKMPSVTTLSRLSLQRCNSGETKFHIDIKGILQPIGAQSDFTCNFR